MALSKREAARRYLQADMAAGYTGQSSERAEIYRETQRRLVKEHGSSLPVHAIVGTARDFDEALTAGEREHQRFMQRSKLRDSSPAGVAAARRDFRAEGSTGGRAPRRGPSSSPRARPRAALRAGASGARGYARARRQITGSSGIAGTGSIALEALGVGVGLALLYLVLSPNGSKAFASLLSGITSAVRVLISPVDPLNPTGSSSSSTGGLAAYNAAHPQSNTPVSAATVKRQSKKLNPAFGPAPGISSAGAGLVEGTL